MRAFFDATTRMALRFRWITVTVTLILIVLGVFSYFQLNQELIPDIEFPQTFVLSQNGGASSDQILHMYSDPLEDETAEIDGVVNVESTSQKGLSFIIVRNEFGLNQSRVTDDVQAAADQLALPVRRLVPAEGQSPEDVIGELSPEAIVWLLDYAEREDINFAAQLDSAVWESFSPEALGAFPEAIIDNLETDLKNDIYEKRVVADATLPETPPALPDSWQEDHPSVDRFETAADLAELTDNRSLASVFNDFVEDGYVIGALGTTDDLTPDDLAIYIDVQNRCESFREQTTGSVVLNGENPCSFVSDLTADVVLAMSDDILAGLPDDYLAQLDFDARNEVAETYLASQLTGRESRTPVAVLPESWRVDAPSLLTFNFSDLPLGFITVSSDQLSEQALEDIVEDNLVPRLKDLDLVADVTVFGGGQITFNDQPANPDGDQVAATDGNNPGDDDPVSDNSSRDDAANPGNAGDSPALPQIWTAFAPQFFEGVDFEILTAQDVLDAIELDERYSGVAELLNIVGDRPESEARIAIPPISAELLLYWGEQEEGFFDALSANVIGYLEPEVVAELPIEAPDDATDPMMTIQLGEFWSGLSEQPALAERPLSTAADLVNFNGSAAELLSMIVETLNANGQEEFAILLINDLTPQAINGVLEAEPDFLETLARTDSGQQVMRYFPPDVLQTEVVSSYIDTELDGDLQTELQNIRDGETEAAIARVDTGTQVELLVDPDAPALPGSWGQIANFIGAPLDNAADVINVRALPNYATGADFMNELAVDNFGQARVRELDADVWVYLGENEDTFWQEVSAVALRLIPEEVVAALPEDIQGRINAGAVDFDPPSAPITRTNQQSSLVIGIFKSDDANTVEAWQDVEVVLEDLPDGIEISVPFEQASFIQESINGVRNEGTTGAIMAIIVILVFMNLSVRSTLVTSVSIPASVMTALVLMTVVPSNVYDVLAPILDDVGRDSTLGSILEVLLRLFPERYTLNIMTLSGLTVAIGRVVDDSIVVLENIYRNVMHGEDKQSAILNGTREVSVAIFAATLTTMVVFLPLGLFGGVTGAFFLPFGLAVTYSLAASFVVAITTIPALAYFFISKESMPEEGQIKITDDMSNLEKRVTGVKNVLIRNIDALAHTYSRTIQWVLRNRLITIAIAFASLIFGMYLLGRLPQTFLPQFGDPTITVAVNLPAEAPDGTPITILQTEEKVRQLEDYLDNKQGVETIQTVIGGELNSFDPSSDPDEVVETTASIQVGMRSQSDIDALLDDLRDYSENLFNDVDGDGKVEPDVNAVRVSGIQEQGDFGGFALVLSGPEGITLDDLAEYNDAILAELNSISDLANVESSLGDLGNGNGNGETTYIRIDGVPAIRYTGELETQDTLGLTNQALLDVQKVVDNLRAERDDLTAAVEVSKGFESEQQEDGFRQLGISMGIATLIVYLLLALTFNNLIHPITILVSLPLSVVGAAVALTVTGRVLGLSSMIGLLMLIGIVVTNAVVLLDRVQQNKREKDMNTYDALVEAGTVRLRPILMTAISTTMGVLPLALGFTEGAIIAAELGTVVIGGLVSSTFLTLLVVPVVYSLFDSAQRSALRLFKGGGEATA